MSPSLPQPRGQLIWTGLVVLTLGLVALFQSADFGQETANNPLSSADMVHAWNPLPAAESQSDLPASGPSRSPSSEMGSLH